MIKNSSRIYVIIRGALAFAILALFAFSCPRDDGHQQSTPLILISFDGFRWDYFEKTETPHLDEIIQTGVRAKGLVPVFPSKTFPNHISIITGRYPENHGIISNRMYDPIFDERYYIGEGSAPVKDGKWYDAEPVWVTAERQGKTAMTMFWPASEAEIMGYRPTEFFVYDGSVPDHARVEQVLKWLDYSDHNRPDFISLYFSRTDHVGHQYGPNSKELEQAVRDLDSAIGHLINGLKNRNIYDAVNLLIVSDHGMTEIMSDSVVFLDDYINMESVDVIDWSPVAAIRPDSSLENYVYSTLKGAHKKMSVYKQGEAPEQFHYRKHRRIPPITGVAADHWSITTRDYFNTDNNAARYTGGNHGFDPSLPNMRGIFIGRGPNLKENYKAKGFTNIHLYELMCNLLEIFPAQNDGHPDSTRHFLKEK